MVVSRVINGISIDIEIEEGNGVYFDNEIVDQLPGYDVESIKEFLYSRNEEYAPYSVMWELTNRCNLHCRFCYINCDGVVYRKFIPLEECRTIIDDLVDCGMLFCTLTGGECLLHPDFCEIYSYLKQKGVLVTLFTNATLLKEKHFELFSHLPPYKIEVSIYGISEKGFSNVTEIQGEQWLQVLNNVKRLKNMEIQVICKTPLNTLTEAETPLIREWCQNNGLPFYNSPELLDSYEGASMDQYAVSPGVQRHFYTQQLKNAMEQSKLEFAYKRAFECAGGRTSMFVAHNLRVYPCSASFGIEELSVPIYPEGMKAAYIGLQRIIAGLAGKRISHCQGCIYNDVCDRCIVDEYKQRKDSSDFCITFQKDIENLPVSEGF